MLYKEKKFGVLFPFFTDGASGTDPEASTAFSRIRSEIAKSFGRKNGSSNGSPQ